MNAHSVDIINFPKITTGEDEECISEPTTIFVLHFDRQVFVQESFAKTETA